MDKEGMGENLFSVTSTSGDANLRSSVLDLRKPPMVMISEELEVIDLGERWLLFLDGREKQNKDKRQSKVIGWIIDQGLVGKNSKLKILLEAWMMIDGRQVFTTMNVLWATTGNKVGSWYSNQERRSQS